MKICPYCHLENPDEAKHCLACGKKLTDEKPNWFGLRKRKAKSEGEVAQANLEETSTPNTQPTPESVQTEPNRNEDHAFENQEKEQESKSILDRLLHADQPTEQVEYTPLSSRLQPDISSVDLEEERRRRQEQLERQQKAQREAQEAMQPESPKNDKQKMLLTAVICLLSCLVLVLALIVATQGSRDRNNRWDSPTSTSSIKRYFDDSYTDDWKSTQTETNSFEEIEDTQWVDDEESGQFIEDILSEEGPQTSASNVYVTHYVMKVRQQPSLDAESISSLDAQEQVEIVSTKTDGNGAIWGLLAHDEGWVCIQDNQQTYLSSIE